MLLGQVVLTSKLHQNYGCSFDMIYIGLGKNHLHIKVTLNFFFDTALIFTLKCFDITSLYHFNATLILF